MFFLLDSKNIFGRAFIRLTAAISYKFVLAHRAKMLFGSQFILACAYGGRVGILQKGIEPTTILFRPAVKSSNFELWECIPDEEKNCKHPRSFRKVKAKLTIMFGGSMYAFVTNNFDKRAHYLVKGKRGGEVIESGVVVGKMDEVPSTQDDRILSVKNGATDIFTWNEKQEIPYWISFLLINNGERMITAIYSFLNSWRFPEVNVDVPYYYHEPKPVPQLIANSKYEALYMAIDNQGWVTVVAKRNWIQSK